MILYDIVHATYRSWCKWFHRKYRVVPRDGHNRYYNLQCGRCGERWRQTD